MRIRFFRWLAIKTLNVSLWANAKASEATASTTIDIRLGAERPYAPRYKWRRR